MNNSPEPTGITDGLRKIIGERDAEIVKLRAMKTPLYSKLKSHELKQPMHTAFTEGMQDFMQEKRDVQDRIQQLTEALASAHRQLSRYITTAEVVTYV